MTDKVAVFDYLDEMSKRASKLCTPRACISWLGWRVHKHYQLDHVEAERLVDEWIIDRAEQAIQHDE